MVGLSLFTAASLGCALATAEGFLVAMRFAQGLGAAIVLPAALSIVMNMFPEGPERNKALGAWGAIGASGAALGVMAGGLLTRYLGWEYIFYLNVPIGAAALPLAPRVVPESRLTTERRRYDPFGAVAVTGGLSLLVYAISTAPQSGLIGGGILWSTQVPVHGHFWASLAGPFFIVGVGTAFAFIPVSIAALAGVAEHEAGLASGLINTSQQPGGRSVSP